MPVPASTDHEPILDRLRRCELRVIGRMPWSSNLTILVELVDPNADASSEAKPDLAIYKPHVGERPLWDFPDGLYRREVAAYELAQALRWDLVPPTVQRDGSYGVGSLQWFVHADPDEHYFVLLEDESMHDQLRRLAVFDLVANSTDRKGGHVLHDGDGRLWAIDNGLCLHTDFKVRTVIWDFGGEHLPADLAEDLDRFLREPLPTELTDLVTAGEQEALLARARAVLTAGRLPIDPTGRRHPWPLI